MTRRSFSFLRSSLVYIMESGVTSERLSPVEIGSLVQNSNEDVTDKYCVGDNGLSPEQERILSGAQLSEARDFRNKNGQNITVTPVIVDFRRILQCKSITDIVPGVANQELLHAVVGLYNTSLNEMTPDVLYASVCDKQARTIILLRNSSDAVTESNTRKSEPVKEESTEDEVTATDKSADVEDKTLNVEDVYTADDTGPGFYHGVFSDQDADDDEESDDEEEEEDEDYSHGVRTFLKNVRTRKKHIRSTPDPIVQQHIGIEHRLVGAATFEKSYCNPGEKIIHLTLVAVRKKFQKAGLGKYLLSQVKDMTTVGQYEAVVVHADNSAIDFFHRYGFTDDIVLNSRWSELAEQYTNCTLMCYLPPFTNEGISGCSIPELDIIAMEKEIKKWRERSVEAYRAEMGCVNRMRHEVIHLRALVSSQQDLITVLTNDNEKVRKEKYLIEKEYLDYRLSTTKAAFNTTYSDDDDDMPGDKLIKDLERELSRTSITNRDSTAKGSSNYMISRGSRAAPYDHGKDTENFYQVTHDFDKALKEDPSITTLYHVEMVTKAILPQSYKESYSTQVDLLNDPSMMTRLYLSGGLEKSLRSPDILRKGFSEKDMSHGDYGRGLYFTKYPSKAAQYAPLGMLILAEVALGNTETVVKKDRTRKAPSKMFDSIITPGRLCSDDVDQKLCQEYVIFNVHQSLPLYLITYSPTESQASRHSTTSTKP